MNVNNKQGGEAYTQDDLDLLMAIASQAAVAIENANLFEETLALTYLDSLTRLYNHPSFQKMLERDLDRAKRYSHPLSLVLIDIDDFKPYNDRYGHAAGETALRTISQLICAQSRSSDIVCRYGGDQFAVLLPETDSKNAKHFAEKVRESVDAHYFRGKAGDVAENLTVSVGVAAYPEDARSQVALVDLSSDALYEAKFSGKNTVSGPGEL
jgi:diguanylate cyclase (GGDEF)-like protein